MHRLPILSQQSPPTAQAHTSHWKLSSFIWIIYNGEEEWSVGGQDNVNVPMYVCMYEVVQHLKVQVFHFGPGMDEQRLRKAATFSLLLRNVESIFLYSVWGWGCEGRLGSSGRNKHIESWKHRTFLHMQVSVSQRTILQTTGGQTTHTLIKQTGSGWES